MFVFGRYAEELPSDDSDDSDFYMDPGSDDEESANTASTSRG